MAIDKRYLAHLTLVLAGLGVVSALYSVDANFVFLHGGLLAILAGLLLLAPRFGFVVTRIVYAALMVAAVTLAVLHADNLESYGPLLRETVDALFQTSQAEAVSYLMTFAGPLAWIFAGIWSMSVLVSLWRLPAAPFGLAAGILLLLLGSVSLWFGRDLPLLLYTTARDYHAELANYAASREVQAGALGPLHSDFDGTVVLLLGESVSRHHLGVYGYPRNTTPLMSSSRDQLTVYRDVISTHSHTNESLSQALTLNPRGERKSLLELPDIITTARAAGLTTIWLSNQNAIGIWDNAVAAMAGQADLVRYHDAGSGRQLRRSVFDEALLDSLDSALLQPGGKLIVLHTMAAHFPYCQMIPADFEAPGLSFRDPPFDQRFFGRWFYQMQSQVDEAELAAFLASYNCYDRAISYLDTIFAAVVQRLAAEAGPAFLVFTADHGEAAILDTGHESRLHSHFHVEVPFVTWQNRAWQARNRPMPATDNRPGSLGDLAWTLADLLDIEPLPAASERSLVSPDYQAWPRRTMDGRIGYDVFDAGADTVERARANLYGLPPDVRARVWVHRMNSGAALLEAGDLFSGFEMDVVWNGQAFSVFHPPAPDVGLTLAGQLKQDRPGRHYWLDWKNPDFTNVPVALQALEVHDADHGIKPRTLVETAPGPAARALAGAGWTSSYYLPTERIGDCLQRCSKAEQAALAEELWTNFDRDGFTAVSFDMALLPFIETHMRSRLESENIAAYSWAPLLDISSASGASDVTRLLQGRDWIRAMLVTLPTPFRL